MRKNDVESESEVINRLGLWNLNINRDVGIFFSRGKSPK